MKRKPVKYSLSYSCMNYLLLEPQGFFLTFTIAVTFECNSKKKIFQKLFKFHCIYHLVPVYSWLRFLFY